jgi:hypothetical protein
VELTIMTKSGEDIDCLMGYEKFRI